jgi:hypothetical protein
MYVYQKFPDRLSTAVQAKPGKRYKAIGGKLGRHFSPIGCGSAVGSVLNVRGKEAVDDRSVFAHYAIEVSRYDFRSLDCFGALTAPT